MVRAASDAELERRIRERAAALWIEDGRPEGREREYSEKARELIAIEENQELTTRPAPRSDAVGGRQPLESPRTVENLGDFPGLADQGGQTVTPKRPSKREGR